MKSLWLKLNLLGITAFCWVFLAALAARSAPGNALQFDGVNGYVVVTNNPALNALPLTVTGWFRTTDAAYPIQTIASKYVDGTGNGWFIMVQNGRLRGYYSETLSVRAMDITTPGNVTDGFWHHAAMSVDRNGGSLYLDGILVGTNSWNGTAGPPTSTDPLYFGRYSSTANRYDGQLDEITLWNRSLGIAEINYIKHRQLAGNEDGLIGLWHFDETSGTAAADSTTNGFTGLLADNPVQTNSAAPLVFNAVAGNALKMAGTGDYMTVPDDPSLDSVPLTLMAWVRTSYSSSAAGGVISKYADASFNGYNMFVYNGHIRAWYFKDSANAVYGGGEGLDGGFIADGQWHHLAFVVDTVQGRLFVDGVQTAAINWTGTAGPATTTVPFQVGRYSTFANSLPGDIDEVSVWNVALSAAQVATYEHTALAGSESGLLGAWRFSEGTGTSVADLSPFARSATLMNNPAWTGSTAYLGDGTSAIQTTLGYVQWFKQFAINTIPADSNFEARTPCSVRRLDDFGAPQSSTSAQVTVPCVLQSANTGTQFPITVNNNQFSTTLSPYLAAVPQPTAGGIEETPTVTLQPQSGTQIASASDVFQVTATEMLSINAQPAAVADVQSSPPAQLLQFDGTLFFGGVPTTFSSIANSPSPGVVDSSGIHTILAINNNSGVVTGHPTQIFGDGTALNVVLNDNGDAALTGAQFIQYSDFAR